MNNKQTLENSKKQSSKQQQNIYKEEFPELSPSLEFDKKKPPTQSDLNGEGCDNYVGLGENSDDDYYLKISNSLIDDESDRKYVERNVMQKNPETNGQKLNDTIKNQFIRQTIEEIYQKNGQKCQPILLMKLKSAKTMEYELDQQDILDVFQQHFKVSEVVTQPGGRALIHFHNLPDAVIALNFFNNYCIEELCLTIQLELYQQITYQENPWKSTQNHSQVVKYTCRYEIQIPNDKEFQVARKIIGAKGQNMKDIINYCIGTNSQDLLKLRLRGQGSGYKEGQNKKESDEPLHLCVSSKYQDIYDKACQKVEFLLKQIYFDYKQFCVKKGIIDQNLVIKKEDNSNLNGKSLAYGGQVQQFMRFDMQPIQDNIYSNNNNNQKFSYDYTQNEKNLNNQIKENRNQMKKFSY